MRDNKNRAHRDQTGRGAAHVLASPPVHTAGERKTMRQGLRILARIIARAHLRRRADRRSSSAAPGPPPGE